MRQSEDDVEVRNGQQFSRARGQPLARAFPWHLGQCRLRHELNEMA
jgi:hypothetical protein